jgi:hypothetical protein
MKKTISALALAASLALGATAGYAADDAKKTPAFANPFDSSSWHNHDKEAKLNQTVAINPADPAFWMSFMEPKKHVVMHNGMTNPATYGQMMNPGFWMQTMNPATWMKWMDPASYKVAMDPATMAYWMQPGAYMHMMDMSSFTQAMNPENYTKMMAEAKMDQWMNPESYKVASADGEVAVPNFFNPAAWMSMFTAAATSATSTEDKKS